MGLMYFIDREAPCLCPVSCLNAVTPAWNLSLLSWNSLFRIVVLQNVLYLAHSFQHLKRVIICCWPRQRCTKAVLPLSLLTWSVNCLQWRNEWDSLHCSKCPNNLSPIKSFSTEWFSTQPILWRNHMLKSKRFHGAQYKHSRTILIEMKHVFWWKAGTFLVPHTTLIAAFWQCCI